jgi:hypothetical protein
LSLKHLAIGIDQRDIVPARHRHLLFQRHFQAPWKMPAHTHLAHPRQPLERASRLLKINGEKTAADRAPDHIIQLDQIHLLRRAGQLHRTQLEYRQLQRITQAAI